MNEVTCVDCGLNYSEMGLDLVLPGEQWRRLFPEERGLLCANCICKRARGIGGTSILGWVNKGETQDTLNARQHLTRLLNIVAPHVEPLSSLSGLVTQLDNYIAGIRRIA